jgi:hypothetical protein
MSESALMLDWITRKRREWDNAVTDLEFEEWLENEEGGDSTIMAMEKCEREETSDLHSALLTAINAVGDINKNGCGIELDVNGHELAVVVRRGAASVDFTAMMRKTDSIHVSPTVLKGVLREAARCIEVADDMLRTMTGVKLNAGKTLTAISDVVKLLDAER